MHLVKGVQKFLNDQGWHVYVDWQDQSMPPQPSRETALKIQRRIKELNWFLFLATENSMASRWCPWELGFADGAKPYDSILVIPTRDLSGRSHGNEYIQLYRRVDESHGLIGAFLPNGNGNLVRGMVPP